MRFLIGKTGFEVSKNKLKLAETDPPPTPLSDVAPNAQTSEMTCGECGRDFLQDIQTARCESCQVNFCGYDCAIKHQERTTHYLTHLIT